mmetsp:Transcript_21756/g.55665  ORF Transcript_21756/g.55665 Transcript_21756/m.55665 type:complete len:210 (-) Transcript_21756:983-1612(-)
MSCREGSTGGVRRCKKWISMSTSAKDDTVPRLRSLMPRAWAQALRQSPRVLMRSSSLTYCPSSLEFTTASTLFTLMSQATMPGRRGLQCRMGTCAPKRGSTWYFSMRPSSDEMSRSTLICEARVVARGTRTQTSTSLLAVQKPFTAEPKGMTWAPSTMPSSCCCKAFKKSCICAKCWALGTRSWASRSTSEVSLSTTDGSNLAVRGALS